MEWIDIKSQAALQEIQELSAGERILILKYNPDCMVSFMIRQLLQREWNEGLMNMKTYILDVTQYKEIAEKISKEYGVDHESPEVILVKDGKCIHSKLNGYIQFKDLKQFANRG